MPDVEALNAVVVACVGLGAWALAMLGLVDSLVRRRGGRRSPTNAEISARVRQLALEGALPPGWSRRDAERLVRVRARRARLV